jgi:hypothetical protein
MTRLFDPNFDPLEELDFCKQQLLIVKQEQLQLQHNIHEIARAFNQQSHLVKQLLDQNRDLNNILQGREFRS